MKSEISNKYNYPKENTKKKKKKNKSKSLKKKTLLNMLTKRKIKTKNFLNLLTNHADKAIQTKKRINSSQKIMRI